MKLRIWQEKTKESEPEWFLRLIKDEYNDDVILAVVDEDGDTVECGCLISFGNEKRPQRRKCVNPNLGFERDKDNRIKID